MARSKASRGKPPWQMRSGNSPNKQITGVGMVGGEGQLGGTGHMANIKAMMEAKKAADAAGEDWDTTAWIKENLEGVIILGKRKNLLVGGTGEGGSGGNARFAAMHDKLHGGGGPDLQPSATPIAKNIKYKK